MGIRWFNGPIPVFHFIIPIEYTYVFYFEKQEFSIYHLFTLELPKMASLDIGKTDINSFLISFSLFGIFLASKYLSKDEPISIILVFLGVIIFTVGVRGLVNRDLEDRNLRKLQAENTGLENRIKDLELRTKGAKLSFVIENITAEKDFDYDEDPPHKELNSVKYSIDLRLFNESNEVDNGIKEINVEIQNKNSVEKCFVEYNRGMIIPARRAQGIKIKAYKAPYLGKEGDEILVHVITMDNQEVSNSRRVGLYYNGPNTRDRMKEFEAPLD